MDRRSMFFLSQERRGAQERQPWTGKKKNVKRLLHTPKGTQGLTTRVSQPGTRYTFMWQVKRTEDCISGKGGGNNLNAYPGATKEACGKNVPGDHNPSGVGQGITKGRKPRERGTCDAKHEVLLPVPPKRPGETCSARLT